MFGTVGLPISGRYVWQIWPASASAPKERITYGSERYTNESKRLLGFLDYQLAGRDVNDTFHCAYCPLPRHTRHRTLAEGSSGPRKGLEVQSTTYFSPTFTPSAKEKTDTTKTMEFANTGSHCSSPECKQHDFLPFTCSKCKGVFCLEHRSVLSHSCESSNVDNKIVPECPMCGRMVDSSGAADVNDAVERHIASGCTMFVKATSLNTARKCSIESCKVKDIVEMKCKHCDEHFCVAHRMPRDHLCVPEPVHTGFFSTSRRRCVQVRA